ncbi:MAG: ATP-binding protein [Acidimicrobiales bacterium]
MRAERAFDPVAGSVPAARSFVLSCLQKLPPATGERVAVMISELATNAVLYARTAFAVAVELTDSYVRVEVTDSGTGGVPVLSEPPPPSQLHGRGLVIVGELADEWGADGPRAGGGKMVWFRVDLDTAGKPVGSGASVN